ncbi:MAG: permease [Pyrinomonadaceae bacterium]|nr:permease [Pyrinomonadaceae bacterium]
MQGSMVAEALPAERASFIRKTYAHLALAILAFALFEAYLVMSGAGLWAAQLMVSTQFSWLIVLGLFMGVSWLANTWARSQTSIYMQYMGLVLFTLGWSVIFLPLMFMATYYSGDSLAVPKAGVVAMGLFLGLTAVVFLTRKDFSFLGPILAIGGFVALGFIVSGIVFGFSLGNIFAFAMVAFAGGSILYETSNMMHHYRTDQHVAASLGLFASIALLFYYLVTIFSGRD